MFRSKRGGNLGPWQGSVWVQRKRIYGSYWGLNMGPSVSTRKETVLVQNRWGFGSMTRVCLSARKEDLWVLLGTQYGSQFEYKRAEYFSPKEMGIWVHEMGLCGRRKERLYGSCCWLNMGPILSTRKENILVQNRCEFGSMTWACVRAGKKGCKGPAGDSIWIPAWVQETPVCSLSSTGEVLLQLTTCATFLVYVAKHRRQPVS